MPVVSDALSYWMRFTHESLADMMTSKPTRASRTTKSPWGNLTSL